MTTVRRDPDTDLPVSDDRPGTGAPAADGLQGEGNYEAARRHRESAEHFVQSGRVAPAAEQAAPADGAEARELEEAEREGRSHARE